MSAARVLAPLRSADGPPGPAPDPRTLLPSANEPAAALDRLDALARALAEAEPQSAARAAVEGGIELLDASGGAVATLAPDGHTLELVAATGYSRQLVEARRRFPLSRGIPLARAASTGEPVYAGRASPLLICGADGELHRDRPASVALPLVADGEPVGAIGFSFASLDLAERQHGILLLLASMCGAALGRAHRSVLLDRLGRLQDLAAALTRAVEPPEVARVLVEAAMEGVGADGALLARLTEAGDTITTLAAEGYPDEMVAWGRQLRLRAQVPLADAIRQLKPVVCETPAEILESYPLLEWETRELGTAAIVALPLLTDHHPIGAVRVSFREPRVIDHEQFEFMRSLAMLGGQTLDRALRARQQDRTSRLQGLTARLSHALTPEEVGKAIVDSGIELLGAAGGAVAETTEKGTLRVLASAGLPKELLGESREFSLDAKTPLGRLLRRKKPVLLATRGDAAKADPWLSEQLAMLGHNALAFAPFERKGGVRGGLLLVLRDEIDVIPEDTPFLSTIADLCAQTLERAQLHAFVDQSRRRLETLLERLHEGVLTVDRRLRVEYANPEAASLLGRAATVGRKLPSYWGSFPLREFAQELPRDNGGTPVETRFTDGDAATYEVVGIPGPDSTVLVLRDVSQRVRRERAEKEFVQNAAHELRSPLAAIASAVDALELGAKDEDWARDYFIASVAAAIERLGRLITALLTLAHAQADPDWLTLEPVDVAPALHEIARAVPAKPGVRVQVRCPDDAQVVAEPTLLAAALGNLAENAARHVPSGTITLFCGKPHDGVCEISVRDTGPGIDAETQARMFERFSRHDHDDSGHGLGLAIVQAMAAALGGSLTLSSEPGKGTDVSLTLPAP